VDEDVPRVAQNERLEPVEPGLAGDRGGGGDGASRVLAHRARVDARGG